MKEKTGRRQGTVLNHWKSQSQDRGRFSVFREQIDTRHGTDPCLTVGKCDPYGTRPVKGIYIDTDNGWSEKGTGTTVKNNSTTVVVNTVKSAESTASNIEQVSLNSLPREGEPGTSQILPNPDGTPKQKRWYGPDGNAERDRDYNGPGNLPFPHDHEWENGKRGKEHLPPDPSYKMDWEPVIGVGLVVICTVGIVAVVADDVIGVGVVDDFLFVSLGAGFGEGMIKVFG